MAIPYPRNLKKIFQIKKKPKISTFLNVILVNKTWTKREKRKWKIKVLITFLECAMYITCSTCPSTKGMFQNSKRILKWSKYDIIQKGNVSNFERIWRIGNLKSFQDHKNSWKAHYRSDSPKSFRIDSRPEIIESTRYQYCPENNHDPPTVHGGTFEYG